MRDRPNTGWALRVTASILALLVYPLSFGPACWLADRQIVPFDVVFKGYAPIISTMRDIETVRGVFIWYAEVGSPGRPFTALMLLITSSIEGSSGDLIDGSDDAGLPDADENVILDESPCLTNPPPKVTFQGVPPDG